MVEVYQTLKGRVTIEYRPVDEYGQPYKDRIVLPDGLKPHTGRLLIEELESRRFEPFIVVR